MSHILFSIYACYLNITYYIYLTFTCLNEKFRTYECRNFYISWYFSSQEKKLLLNVLVFFIKSLKINFIVTKNLPRACIGVIHWGESVVPPLGKIYNSQFSPNSQYNQKNCSVVEKKIRNEFSVARSCVSERLFDFFFFCF